MALALGYPKEGAQLLISHGKNGLRCVLRRRSNYGTIQEDQFSPSINWSQGGPLVERGWITITAPIQWRNDDVKWSASFHTGTDDAGNDDYEGEEVGPTPLIAAMRCFVASKLGEEVEIP